LAQAGEAEASPQADGKGEQHAPQKSHQVKSHQVKRHQQRAAAADVAPSQSGKRKR
jgi:hypothetical protein